MRASRTWRLVAVWTVLTLAAGGVMAWALLSPEPLAARAWFTPGPMTHGHHSIELACGSCHVDAFGGGEVLETSCTGCHGAQLDAANDAHPRTKFTDPRNADLLSVIDARNCVSCHSEHRPEMTHPMGLTLPPDYCLTCHIDIGTERDTHAGLGFETCASAGCHNYHDNRALYADFLLRHADDPILTAMARVPDRLPGAGVPQPLPSAAPLPTQAPALTGAAMDDWLASAHAEAGMGCGSCHASGGAWVQRPDHSACAGCHGDEVDGFLAGKHGMRLAVDLPPMTPAMARLPMQPQAAHTELGCGSCHAAHRFDVHTAAVESCLSCHADDHSLAYVGSPHHQLWQQEQAGERPPGSGVSCATCHLPRAQHQRAGVTTIRVQHNQNDGLRPNEAMVRPVCQNCHGLGFALDALADPELIRRNFPHAPTHHVESIDMAVRRAEADRARRAVDSSPGP